MKTGYGIIQKRSDDTLGCFHNILINYPDGDTHTQIYDGKYVIEIMLDKSQCLLINVDSFNYGYQFVTGNVISSYRPKFLYTKDYFHSIFKNKNIEYLKIDTLFVFGRNCYQVKIKYKDNNEIKNDYTSYYFDVESFLPLGKRSLFEYAGSKLEDLFIISNIITSQNSSEDFFNYKVYKDSGFKIYYPNNYIQNSEENKQDSIVESEFSLEKYKGKIVVMDFWYIGCGPCYKLMPVMEKLSSEYPNVSFVGINPFDKIEKINKFIESRKLKYPVYSVPDYEKKYNITGYPVVLIFDKKGKIIKRLNGYFESHYKTIKKVIEDNISK